jgi:uncharacterized protein (TIGR02453 family)
MIRPGTFDFLTDLIRNNNREWFQDNKARHDTARENVIDFTAELIRGIAALDPTVPADLDPRSCVMRIYRDIRFSKNKTPYKNNFGIGISGQGKNFAGPGYYLHINPEQSFIAGGCWMPAAELLKSIRQEIDYNAEDFRNIIDNKHFKSYYGEPDREHQLKTVPRGYSADHPDIDYLKLKSFTFTHIISAEELMAADAAGRVIEGYSILYPFMAFLRNAIT